MNPHGPRVDERVAKELGIPQTGFLMLMTEGEYRTLSAAVHAIPPALRQHAAVEIGAGVGTSTAVIAEAMRRVSDPARLTTVDALLMGPKRLHVVTDGRFASQRQAIAESISPYPVQVRTEASEPLLLRWSDPLSFLHIDGDHHEAAVTADLAWADHVAPGGLLVLHDIGKRVTTDAGPTGALLRWLAVRLSWRVLVQVQSLLVLQRVPT
jgi:hypothetical protein